MPTDPTIFPPSPLDAIWLAVSSELQKAPTLGRVKTWQAAGGDADDWIPTTLEAMPAVRIAPGFGAFRFVDECRHSGPMTIAMDLAVPRANVSELNNFWFAVARVLAWRKSEAPAAWRNRAMKLGISTCTLTVPAVAPRLIAAGRGLAGRGQIDLTINVSY